MVLAYSVRLDVHDRSRSAVAVVLGQMKDQIGARHLHVERQRFLETVLPVDGESQVVDVELLRLGNVEDSKDRDHAPEAHRHVDRVARSALQGHPPRHRRCPGRESNPHALASRRV